MAVKRCPSCGDLYLAAVDVCADCGETLIEVESQPDAEPPSDEAAGPRVESSSEFDEWDLGAWTQEGRRLVDGMLANAQIPRSWQGSTLLTPTGARDHVDDLVAAVSASDAQVGGGDEGETVGYEVSDWTDDALDRLVALLQRDQIPYRWDADGDLEVNVEHEDTVDAIFGELAGEDPDGTPHREEVSDEDDDMAGHQALSDVFVAADRLARNPADATGARTLADVRERLNGMALPFGLSPKLWADMVERVGGLDDLLGDPGSEGDEIVAYAAPLRDLLRDYV